jgi:galactose mutarotase-like enzyme
VDAIVNLIGHENRFDIREEQGFAVHVLSNDKLALAVVPELGARIISLKNVRSGREWMWHPPGGLKLFPNRLGDDFAQSPLAGLDECLPTVAPCSWRGRELPDHGEVWPVPWQVDKSAWEVGVLRTSIKLAVSPLEFERTIELRDNEVCLSYQLINRNGAAECYLWAMHPLLQFEEGDQFELPACTRARLNDKAWSETVKAIVPEGQCAKAFARPVHEGFAGISNRDTGDRLSFEWNPKENDTLGLWLTRGGWHGYHHLALEPTNAAHDALAIAAQETRCGVVGADGSVTWDVRIRVES